MPEAQVTVTPNSGYRYRAHILRDAGGKAIAEAVTDIDYIKLQEQRPTATNLSREPWEHP
jgi:hypothetical protein